ncbi:MAG: 1-deoxy-D-xylulose-5-phosphate reductoisomerase [Dehalococcoidia bacterium]|nr:1-deoxy-D-xylulose-5-phosphate reductoisomerase [Dehalococcoidia bacterium]
MGGLKRIAILGSTGSIGQQTLEVARAFSDKFKIIALGAGTNSQLLAGQIKEFKPQIVSFQGPGASLKEMLRPGGPAAPKIVTLEEMASYPDVDLVVVATSGKAGLAPTLAAIRARKELALANKEVLVMAGAIVTAEARKHGVKIRPVDSEHSAIWQCLKGEQRGSVARLILTASGGPFLRYPAKRLKTITPEQALAHPTWKMGRKVTIDSATLMNKGMEVIEAHWLFGLPYNRIGVVIHRESIVHSMVQFVDGSIKAQLSRPDMRLPIQYALGYPDRGFNPDLPVMDWDKALALNFEPPDLPRFPCLRLAREAGEEGGTYPAVLCAADEVAVDRFLSHGICFADIAPLVEDALDHHRGVKRPSLGEILEADAWARQYATRWRSHRT